MRDELVTVDTNVWIFALRKESAYPACEALLFDWLPDLRIYMPLQIFLELQRNFSAGEMRRFILALTRARSLTWDYTPARSDLIGQWAQRWAKKEAAIRYLVSENRDFLKGLPALPFTVLSSHETTQLLVP